MKIELLADHAESIPMLEDWYISEWEPYYGASGPGNARADLESRLNRDEIPMGIVAADGEEIYGIAALDRDAATGLTPSVVGLLVRPSQRGQGIATALLEFAEHMAKRLGYGRLYISSAILCDLLVRLGWHSVGETEFLNEEKGSIFVRYL